MDTTARASLRRDARKQSVYIATSDLEEILAEAERLERSLSWVMQRAWRLSRDIIKSFPASDIGRY